MTRTPKLLTNLAAVGALAVASVGCGNAPSEASSDGGATGRSSAQSTAHAQAVKFAQCMRDHGVSGFPDPGASGELTIDGVVNDAGIDPNTASWTNAIGACKHLRPSGFTGHARTAQQQAFALKFAQCMREHGVPDFPDPTRDGPLIDTTRIPSAAGRGARDIPGFDDAAHTCGKLYAGDAGVKAQ